MEYLLWIIWISKTELYKCLEEDLEDQSALYNVVYCFEFLDQNLDAIAFLNKYIDKTHIAKLLGTKWDVCTMV
jgi:hypothetical protein